jgi:hypothetical protein
VVPFFSLFCSRVDGVGSHRRMAEAVRGSSDPDVVLNADGARAQFSVSLARHLDRQRTIGEIIARVRMELTASGQSPPAPGKIENEVRRPIECMNSNDWLFPRNRDAPALSVMRELQRSVPSAAREQAHRPLCAPVTSVSSAVAACQAADQPGSSRTQLTSPVNRTLSNRRCMAFPHNHDTTENNT